MTTVHVYELYKWLDLTVLANFQAQDCSIDKSGV